MTKFCPVDAWLPVTIRRILPSPIWGDKVETMSKSKEIQLVSRPTGEPTLDNFKLIEVDIPDLEADQILVKNSWMSVDPYMRDRMNEDEEGAESYVGGFPLNETLTGHAIGTVMESRYEDLPVGSQVVRFFGWRESYVFPGMFVEKIDPIEGIPIEAFLGVLGMTGSTAYFGLFHTGEVEPTDTVYVSSASGAIGMVACQLAKALGCRVVGSAGSQEKVDWLEKEIGIDCAINYKDDDVAAQMAKACPDGIDVYFDNVGGEQLEVAIDLMNDFGRIVACGMISGYNTGNRQPGPSNLVMINTKRITMKGFIITDFDDKLPEFYDYMGKMIEEGKVIWKDTVLEGVEKSPEAFIRLFEGKSIGKMLVKF